MIPLDDTLGVIGDYGFFKGYMTTFDVSNTGSATIGQYTIAADKIDTITSLLPYSVDVNTVVYGFNATAAQLVAGTATAASTNNAVVKRTVYAITVPKANVDNYISVLFVNQTNIASVAP